MAGSFDSAAVVPPLLLWPGITVRVLYSGTFLSGANFVALFVGMEVLGLAVGVYQSLPVAFGHMGFRVAYTVLAHRLDRVMACPSAR